MAKPNLEPIINGLIAAKPADPIAAAKLKRQLCGQFKVTLGSNADLISAINQRPDADQLIWLKHILKRRAIRTLSGVAPVAVLTKPFACPGNCAYCPSEEDVPRSYLSNEPAVMRAMHCHYEPAKQVSYRIAALTANGHKVNKIELIVIGGTWSYYPDNYQYWYIASCFWAANNYGQEPANQPLTEDADLDALKKWLTTEQIINETTHHKIIGLTLETRPDYINTAELEQMREFGATRIEIGVQAIDDDILKLNNRESTVADIITATKLARDFGFKVTYHIMPALPGSTPERDYELFDQMFSRDEEIKTWRLPALEENFSADTIQAIVSTSVVNNNFNPDQIKFYPTVVTVGSLLYRWWQAGQYQPYTDQQLIDLILKCKLRVPPFVRIIRLIRDIPGDSIIAGNTITNLRQIVQNAGAICRCIRCHEAKAKIADPSLLKLVIRKYGASDAAEYFLSFEDDTATLYGFLRLRLPHDRSQSSFIRELHIYGELAALGEQTNAQHRGLGKRLIALAETIATNSGRSELLIISGVGVRNYYRALGYELINGYMFKKI